MNNEVNSVRDVKRPVASLSCRGVKKFHVLYMLVACAQGTLNSSIAICCSKDARVYL
jgi:hypothetical protein